MNDQTNAARWTRIKALFTAALDLPPAQRPAMLARDAGDDPALMAEVESLLAAHDQPGDFLEPVPVQLRAEALAVDDTSRVGERIGAYRIVGVLGTGGMGDVFRAVRDDDQYRAEVAIKVMRADVRGTLAEQRFKAERQILAELDHRNIARLLDGGTTEGRLPYVVMELVSGEPIDRYCDARNLATRERVQIFLQVCAAVSYAHQHLVVHRDLKPNNILVTADGSVKLLDFGIAKLLEVDPVTGTATATEETVTQLRAMTLDYASPEQVSGGTVTTVSDVYSLGVVMYRLLTGQSPYGARVNDAQRVAEILSDTAPTRPSQVRTGERPRQGIDADLDNILLMALRKEPQRRYGSVEQLANDLRNYLAGLPVHARGNALRYRMGKFLRRRKVEMAAAALVMLSLVGGLWFSIREARETELQRQVAQRHFDSVRKMANTLLFDLHDEVASIPGTTRARELLVKTSLEYLDALYKESGGDPALQEELALAYKKVGDIQGSELMANTGDRNGALQSYARAVALLESLRAADPANQHVGISLATTLLEQAGLLFNTEGGAAALPVIEKTVALNESLGDAITNDYKRAAQFGNTYFTQAKILSSLGRGPESLAAIDKMVATIEELARAHPDENRTLYNLSAAYGNAGIFSDDRMPRAEQIRRSLSLLRKSLSANETLVAREPDNLEYLYSLSATRFDLGEALYWDEQYEKAEETYRQAYAFFQTRAIDPNDARAKYVKASVENGLAKSLVKVRKFDEAEILFVEAEKSLQTQLSGGDALAVQFALATIGIYRGEMYLLLAADAHLSPEVRADFSRKARESLSKGVALARKVDESIKLTADNREALDLGEASLARAEAELAVVNK